MTCLSCEIEILQAKNVEFKSHGSLFCSGTEDSINNLKQQTVVFELRWRSTNAILGRIGGSQLLGRAEVPWKTVVESPKLEMERWVTMIPKKGSVPDDVKPPAVQIAMRVRVPAMAEMEVKKKRNGRLKRWDECGCCKDSGCRCEDYDIFVLVAALEAL
ncbi:hypothetical protein NC652_019375 [Populus alba x Populus x berolinensis]|nr:hypothetical protein NC652_019375 [Populus alba x Populus x berolinensis]